MFKINSQPRYIHDCDNCLFLGCSKEFDAYWCQDSTSIAGGSVIARYGSEGPQYLSSPTLIALYAGDTNNILFKISQYLLRMGYVKLLVNTDKIKEDKELYEDLWKARKK